MEGKAFHGGGMSAALRLEVLWCEPCDFGKASQHARSDFVPVVKRKDHIRPARPLKDFVGTDRTFEMPANAE